MESLFKKTTIGHWAALGSVVLFTIGVSWALLVPSGLVDPGVRAWACLAQLSAVSLAIGATLTLTGYACGAARKRGVLLATVGLTVLGIILSFMQDRLGQLAVSTVFLLSIPAGLIAARPGEKRKTVVLIMAAYSVLPVLAVCLSRILLFMLGPGSVTALGTLTVNNMATVAGPWAPFVCKLFGYPCANLPFNSLVAVLLSLGIILNVETALRAKRTDIPGLCLIFHAPVAFCWVAIGVLTTAL